MTHLERSKLPELVALTGLDSTGKGHLAAHLRDEYGFLALGASEIIGNAKAERPHLKDIHPDEAARLLKEELGPTFITDHAIALFEANRDTYMGLVIEGIRRLPEIKRVKEHGGIVLHISADPHERFARLVARGRHDAPKTIEDMLVRDTVQMSGGMSDDNGLNMQAIMELADAAVSNRFDDSLYIDAINSLRNIQKS